MKNSKFLWLFSLIFILGIASCSLFDFDGEDNTDNNNDDDTTSCVCYNGGTCVDNDCDCPPGFSGVQCEINDNSDCAGVLCYNGGICVSGNCDCPPGYTGDNCQYEVDPCAGVSCVNGDLDSDCDCNCDSGWMGSDCSTPQPDSYTFIPDDILDICPSLINGNANFAGAGPRVDIDCRAFVLHEKDIFVDVYFNAKQTTDDWTEGLYDNNIHVYSAPNGKKINRIVSSTVSTADYIDDDNERDIIYTSGLVNYFGVLGETSSADFVDYRDCTADAETELNIYFNQMTIELVDE